MENLVHHMKNKLSLQFMKTKTAVSFLLFVLSAYPTLGNKAGFITIKKIEGRSWLIKPDGQPFFAHGITHARNLRTNADLDKFSKACKEIGFNAYGYGCPTPLRSHMPFVESWNHLVPISYYRGKNSVRFIDIFDPKEQSKLESGVKFICQRSRNNPNTIGYCWTDLGSWPLENPAGKNWVDYIRNLPEGTPGQTAYQQFLLTWGGEKGKARDRSFLRLIAREYFRIVGTAQRKFAPNHLVFGERFSFNTFVPEVFEEMQPYVDAIAIQPPFQSNFPKEKLDEIHKLSGKPILLCDFAVRFLDGDKEINGWKPEENSIAGGKAYARYIEQAFNTGYIIGSFWCNPEDSARGFGNEGVKQGFFNEGILPRPGLYQSVQGVNKMIKKKTPVKEN
jgi:hypothetical protein